MAHLPLSPRNVKYHNDRMVSLCCGLKFAFSILNSPAQLLHITCFSMVNVSMRWRSSLHSQFFIILTFLHMLYHNFFMKMSLTSILKFFSLSYLLCANQSNVDCLNCCLPALGPLTMAFLLVLYSASSAVSVMALTTAYATSTAACVIACVFFLHFCHFLFLPLSLVCILYSE